MATIIGAVIFFMNRIPSRPPSTLTRSGYRINRISTAQMLSVIMKPMTSIMVALLTVLTMVAIREAMPKGEKAITNSVIFSMVSLA